MPITNIPSPRVDFIDERTPNKISKAWFMFLYELFHRVGGITGDTTITEVEEMFQPRLTDLPPSSFIDNAPNNPVSDPNAIPRPFIGIDPLFVQDFVTRLEAGLAQLRQEMQDNQTLAALAPAAIPAIESDNAITLDCDTLEPVGYWSPVTDGSSNIIYSGGQVVVAFTCTS